MIAIKILNVMTKIGPIIKDKTNEEKGFDYASIASIIIRAREAMIEEKVIMIPLKLNQVVQKGNDVIIDMVYRFYDAEPNEDGKCDYMDVNIPGEGADKEGWAVYKALSGAYKYAITQTFAIPTIDDAEKDKYTTNNEESNNNDTVTEEYVEDEDKYYISFRDSVEQDCRIEIDKDIFDTYTNSKKTYIKIKNETSRHLEQSDLTEEDMYKRAFEPVESVEETVIKNIEKEKVNEALKDLTSTQFRRIDLHIVNEITIRDVAKLEKVQKSQIQKSLELGLKKIKKFFEE